MQQAVVVQSQATTAHSSLLHRLVLEAKGSRATQQRLVDVISTAHPAAWSASEPAAAPIGPPTADLSTAGNNLRQLYNAAEPLEIDAVGAVAGPAEAVTGLEGLRVAYGAVGLYGELDTLREEVLRRSQQARMLSWSEASDASQVSTGKLWGG